VEEQKYTIEFTEAELHKIMDAIESVDDWVDDEVMSDAAGKITDSLNGFDGVEVYHAEQIKEAIEKAERGDTVYLTSEEAEARMDAFKEGLKGERRGLGVFSVIEII